MTEEEKDYLRIARLGLETVTESRLPAMMAQAPERAILYLFDLAYAMGFAAAQKMEKEGIDIQKFDGRKLSLLDQNHLEPPPPRKKP